MCSLHLNVAPVRVPRSGMSGIDQDEKALACVARTYLTRFPECEHRARRASTAPVGGRLAATAAAAAGTPPPLPPPAPPDAGTASTSSPMPSPSSPAATSSASTATSSASVSAVPKSTAVAAASAQQMDLDVARELVRLDPRAGGFSICGGADASCLPFGPFGSGIFVAHVRTTFFFLMGLLHLRLVSKVSLAAPPLGNC